MQGIKESVENESSGEQDIGDNPVNCGNSSFIKQCITNADSFTKA